MRDTRNEPILTDTYERASDFHPPAECIYVFARSDEDRSTHINHWLSTSTATTIEISTQTPSIFSIVGNSGQYFLRSDSSINSLWSNGNDRSHIFIDITGLTKPVWAALLRSALATDRQVSVVYVEPDSYKLSAAPLEGQIYDLSTRILGIAPLPGFAIFSEQRSEDCIFVPLLGFEGTRFSYLIEQVQPKYDQIIPVVGCPGFKPWYVFETYLGNKRALTDTSAWQSIRYAQGNCPFSCYYLLDEISQSNPRKLLKVAPIGTKPHALGAVLFALSSRHPTELVYDHAIHKMGRTDGSDRLLIYHVSAIASGTGTQRFSRTQAAREMRQSRKPL
ncbi:MAG: hypothetical protein IPO38_05725 [Rhodocyclaceae bacterium]|nr:hypothetical protein [Rhodocyclaceae bacterium]